MLVPGAYRSVCIELELHHLAVNSIMQAGCTKTCQSLLPIAVMLSIHISSSTDGCTRLSGKPRIVVLGSAAQAVLPLSWHAWPFDPCDDR